MNTRTESGSGSDDDDVSNYMSISSDEPSSSSVNYDTDSENSSTDIPAIDANLSSIRGFFGRASETLFPTVASFFGGRLNAPSSEGDDNDEIESLPTRRPRFDPLSVLGSTLSEVFRPLNNGSARPSLFNQVLRTYPGSMMRRSESQKGQLNTSGKIILPSSSLEKILRENQTSFFMSSFDSDNTSELFQSNNAPMIFKISLSSLERATKQTYCGVLEFTAPEGICYIPNWIMSTIGATSGDLCHIERVDSSTIAVGKFIKIQPQCASFLDLPDPKAVLENGLRHYNTLTPGDIFTISSDDSFSNPLSFEVLETLPGNSVIAINDTDLEVDFAPPVGWEDLQPSSMPSARSVLGKKTLSDYKTSGSTTDPYPVVLPSNILFLGPRVA